MALPNNLLDVGLVNSNSLLQQFRAHPKVEDFLRANIQIAVHSTTISDPATFLNFSFDVDGLVAELDKLEALKVGFHYLYLPSFRFHDLKPHYHFIKKHVELTKYSESGIIALKNAVGHTLAYVDEGYHLLMTAIPQSYTKPDTSLYRKTIYSIMAAELFNSVTQNFKELLRGLTEEDMSRPTVKKQTTADTSNFHVLKRDFTFVCSLVDQAVLNANKDSAALKIVLFLNQFGQKDIEELNVSDILDLNAVRSMTVHFACNIEAKDPGVHVLFSRYGLQKIVGNKGTLFTALGIHEATNFMSNLNNADMDVTTELLDILSREGRHTFLQLYVDSPHSYIQMPFKHPVSGALVTCGLSHPSYHTALQSRAHSYLSHMTDLQQKMVGQLACRIEQVVRFEYLQTPNLLDASQHFDMEKMIQLLEEHAILIPFKDSANESLTRVLRDIMAYLVQTLEELYRQHKGVARYNPVWQAFQYELAMEEIIYGRPLSPVDFKLSVSLGTSTESDKSLSHQRGFIGLSPHSRATSEEVPPPLHHWIKQPLQKLRIERLFPLCQALDAEPLVTGAALIKVLLGDLFKLNEDIPITALKSTKPPGRLTGVWLLDALCEDLATKDSFPVPNTFARARELVKSVGKDVKGCLLQGFSETKINFMPALKFRDFNGTKRICWNFRDYVQIQGGNGVPYPHGAVTEMTMKVCVEVERRSLSYSRNLEKYRDHGMPWMEKVLARLPPELKKQATSHLKVVTFVSCVGMISNGDYIDYNNLLQLVQESSSILSQAELQKLQIQSKFTLPKVYNTTIWKLHADIPIRTVMTVAHPLPKSNRPPQNVREDTILAEADVQEVEEQDDLRPMERSEAMYLPERSSKAWSAEELSLIPTDTSVKLKLAYGEYSRRCKEKKLPIRSYNAFRQKMKKTT